MIEKDLALLNEEIAAISLRLAHLSRLLQPFSVDRCKASGESLEKEELHSPVGACIYAETQELRILRYRIEEMIDSLDIDKSDKTITARKG